MACDVELHRKCQCHGCAQDSGRNLQWLWVEPQLFSEMQVWRKDIIMGLFLISSSRMAANRTQSARLLSSALQHFL
ncbi:hypothetical protein Q7C36_009827 [Tachysurus vachellii]|uniref:Uncharacterized protein n=1 Tax=Tachysurus vachellii TaxID=175792 RepID=A0AA88STQ5_TACVA|nr:hypothetical protein Q7C36_009827 [Tachysurus vachellii]